MSIQHYKIYECRKGHVLEIPSEPAPIHQWMITDSALSTPNEPFTLGTYWSHLIPRIPQRSAFDLNPFHLMDATASLNCSICQGTMELKRIQTKWPLFWRFDDPIQSSTTLASLRRHPSIDRDTTIYGSSPKHKVGYRFVGRTVFFCPDNSKSAAHYTAQLGIGESAYLYDGFLGKGRLQSIGAFNTCLDPIPPGQKKGGTTVVSRNFFVRTTENFVRRSARRRCTLYTHKGI
jgi:hypothetical protein